MQELSSGSPSSMCRTDFCTAGGASWVPLYIASGGLLYCKRRCTLASPRQFLRTSPVLLEPHPASFLKILPRMSCRSSDECCLRFFNAYDCTSCILALLQLLRRSTTNAFAGQLDSKVPATQRAVGDCTAREFGNYTYYIHYITVYMVVSLTVEILSLKLSWNTQKREAVPLCRGTSKLCLYARDEGSCTVCKGKWKLYVYVQNVQACQLRIENLPVWKERSLLGSCTSLQRRIIKYILARKRRGSCTAVHWTREAVSVCSRR
eukprot:jgi/Botrbrau1/21152/Bobra.0061s0046.1